jgi:hypothetical protein
LEKNNIDLTDLETDGILINTPHDSFCHATFPFINQFTEYNHHNSAHYPSSCFLFKTRRFGDSIPSDWSDKPIDQIYRVSILSFYFKLGCSLLLLLLTACFQIQNTDTLGGHHEKFWCVEAGGDRLCGLVVRVLGYRSGGLGSIPGEKQ